jgi:hypothetical protein
MTGEAMRTLWLSFNGGKQEEARLGIAPLEYPLSFNIPRVSWVEDRETIVLNEHTASFAVHVDIVAEVGEDIRGRAVGPEDVGGFRLCVGVADTGMADLLPYKSVRDIVVNQYYARFGEAHNIVSPPLPVKDDDILQAENLEIRCGQHRVKLPAQCRFQSCDVLGFIGGFATLRTGDLVSLGTVWRAEFSDEARINGSITFRDHEFNVSVSPRA